MAQDIQLRELHQKVIRKRTITRELSTLHFKQQELDARVKELEKRKQVEQKDVDRLEKGGITSFFYSVIGKKEERLEKERKEATEALQQYEETFLEFERVNHSIEVKETELATLDGYEEKFNKMLQGKRKLLEDSGLEAERAAISQSSVGLTMEIRKSELLSRAQKQVAVLQPIVAAFGQKVERIAEEVVAIERIRTAKENLTLLREQVQNIMPMLETEKESSEKKKVFLEERRECFIIEA